LRLDIQTMRFCKQGPAWDEPFSALAHIHAEGDDYGMVCVSEFLGAAFNTVNDLLGVARHEVCHLVGEGPNQGSGHGPRWLKALQEVSREQRDRCDHVTMTLDRAVRRERRYCAFCGAPERPRP
jgi:hypothetical protein